MSIFGTTDGDAALLAISILLQGNLSEGLFTERLTNFSLGFRETGVWNNKSAKDAMADWAAMANLATIRNYILGWGLSSTVSNFEKYIRAYWYANYGIEKACDASTENTTVNTNRGVEFICRDNFWSFGWGTTCVAGDIRQGNVSEQKYICQNSSWKLASTDVGFGPCTEANQGMVVNNGPDYYTCDSKVWRKATSLERICFEGKCSTYTDSRDGQSYVSVKIGEQTWMAKNLNYDASGSKCYNDEPANCIIYGRLYDWETAKKACPNGWHLPSDAEWDILLTEVGVASTAGTKLKATSGWKTYYGKSGNGTDDLGFSALPGGGGNSKGSFLDVGYNGRWWSATEYDAGYTYRNMAYDYEDVYRGNYGKSDNLFSVRCLQD